MVSGPDTVVDGNKSELLARAGTVVTPLDSAHVLIQPAKNKALVGEKLSIVVIVEKLVKELSSSVK